MSNYVSKPHHSGFFRDELNNVLYSMLKPKRNMKWLKRKRYLYRRIGAWDVLITENIRLS